MFVYMEFPITSLYGLLSTFIGITIIINGIIFYSGYEKNNIKGLPPGYIIGLVWTFLIGCMAYSQWLLLQSIRISDIWIQWLIPSLFLWCILYPAYTSGFRSKKISDIAVVVSWYFSIIVGLLLYKYNWISAGLIGLTTLWCSYVAFVTL